MLKRYLRDWERKRYNPPALDKLLGKSLWRFRFMKVWEVAGISTLQYEEEKSSANVCTIEEARKFIGFTARDHTLPYILSADKEWLVDIVLQSYPPHVARSWNELIRPAFVMVTLCGGWVIPATGYDSRRIFPSEGVVDVSLLHQWSWLLYGDDYFRLTQQNQFSFAAALRRERNIRALPTP